MQKSINETKKVNRVIQTAKGLDCEPLQPNSNLRMICTDEFNEDSVCTLLCHQTRSGIGMGSQVCSCSKIRRGPILIPLGCEWKGNYPDCEDIITTTPNIIGETTTTIGHTTTSSFGTSSQERAKVETSFHRFSGIKDDFVQSMMRDLMATTMATTTEGTTTSWLSDAFDDDQEFAPATTIIPTTLYTTTSLPTTTFLPSTAKPIILPKTMRPETLMPFFDSRMRGAMRYPVIRPPIEPTTTTRATTTTSTTTTTTTTSLTTTSSQPVSEFKLLDPSTTTTQAPPVIESDLSVNRISPEIYRQEVNSVDSFTEEDSEPTNIALEAIQSTLDEFSPEKVNQLKRFIQAFESELKHEAEITDVNHSKTDNDMRNQENMSKADRKAARKMAKSAKKSKSVEKSTGAEIEFCDELEIPENGFVTYDNERRDGSTAIYHCHDGYEIKQRGADRKVSYDHPK